MVAAWVERRVGLLVGWLAGKSVVYLAVKTAEKLVDD